MSDQTESEINEISDSNKAIEKIDLTECEIERTLLNIDEIIQKIKDDRTLNNRKKEYFEKNKALLEEIYGMPVIIVEENKSE